MRVDPSEWPVGKVSQLRVQLVGNGLGQIIHVPAIVVRGVESGPTLGLTAAIHGDELNGIGLIHRLIEGLDPEKLRGTVVAVPVVNVPGYLREQRTFTDGRDLNRIMPGKWDGIPSEVYAFRILERVTCSFDYLLDLHTASSGRANSFYVRADLHNETAAWMAYAQYPEIILHNEPKDGTLRGAMMDRGVPAITIELGNPQRLQRGVVRKGTDGLLNIMRRLGMVDHELHEATRKRKPVVCLSSRWMYTQSGGVLRVFPELGQRIKAGDLVARVDDIYGNTLEEVCVPESGVVIGRSLNPVNPTGSRILNLGTIATSKKLKEVFPHLGVPR
jgi:predicted deacylase